MKNFELELSDENRSYLVEKKMRDMSSILTGFKPGVQYRFSFPNDFGASVIKIYGSYGYEDDEWEIAVLDANGDLCYTTPITDDVLGYIPNEEVNNVLNDIRNLEPGETFDWDAQRGYEMEEE